MDIKYDPHHAMMQWRLPLKRLTKEVDPYQIFLDAIDALKIMPILAAESHPMAYVTNLRPIMVQI